MYAHQRHAGELAAELLDVVNEAELEAFLCRLVRTAGARLAPAAGHELVAVLRDAAERTLPTLTTTALPSATPGSVTAKRAARAYGMELEGISAEDRDYEIARQFVRFAQAAAARASTAPVGVALGRAGREFAPGLLSPHAT
ncbi:hypothetical protein OM076_11410 [Solirubrobacter ginsenosidimutans]|uniref:Uncharacterized protein n=1 Tax=Solirubrobacter ginsenosidimutans TaxID=490573 RepID=A0A9X3S030_9ACTN|nr:hypothetical protein [Solirubrobacter ginsenosidimutans]MDA0160874.1 hypothetical protein [Solirubrobacter ginsenosidimutans]